MLCLVEVLWLLAKSNPLSARGSTRIAIDSSFLVSYIEIRMTLATCGFVRGSFRVSLEHRNFRYKEGNVSAAYHFQRLKALGHNYNLMYAIWILPHVKS